MQRCTIQRLVRVGRKAYLFFWSVGKANGLAHAHAQKCARARVWGGFRRASSTPQPFASARLRASVFLHSFKTSYANITRRNAPEGAFQQRWKGTMRALNHLRFALKIAAISETTSTMNRNTMQISTSSHASIMSQR